MRRALALASRTTGALWVATLIVAILALAAGHGLELVDREVIVIRGGSMSPAIDVGALIVVRATDPGDVRAGDVATIRSPSGTLVTHRVVDVIDADGAIRFRMKGDANMAPDPVLVEANALVGRVELQVPVAGYLLFLLSRPLGVLAMLSWLATLLLTERLLDELAADAERRAARLAPG